MNELWHGTGTRRKPDSRSRAAYQTNLSVALLTRAERTGSLADLREALASAGQAVRDTPPDHAMIGIRLTNLSLVQRALFERTRDDAARPRPTAWRSR